MFLGKAFDIFFGPANKVSMFRRIRDCDLGIFLFELGFGEVGGDDKVEWFIVAGIFLEHSQVF